MFDCETGFYYLQSRYYDPAICRFINADCFAITDSLNLLASNMFAYCENNPVMYRDHHGKYKMLDDWDPSLYSGQKCWQDVLTNALYYATEIHVGIGLTATSFLSLDKHKVIRIIVRVYGIVDIVVSALSLLL